MQNNAALLMPGMAQPSMPLVRTVLIAAAIEVALVLGTGGLITSAMAKIESVVEPPMEVVIEDLPEKPLEPPKPRVEPRPEPRPMARPQPLPEPVVRTAVAPPPEPVRSPSPAIESPVVEVTPPVVPPPPQRSNLAAEREAEFAARVKAAIQAAVVYPSAARAMGFVGRVRVEFRLRDGSPSQARVLLASGVGMIDRAALSAVTTAVFPEAPETLRGKDQVYQVTVQFDLSAAR